MRLPGPDVERGVERDELRVAHREVLALRQALRIGGIPLNEGGVGAVATDDGAVLWAARGVVGPALDLEEVEAGAVVEDGLGVGADEEEGGVHLHLGPPAARVE